MFKKESHPSRSPLKRKPLRNPGESLQEEIHKILDEGVVGALLPVMALLLWTVQEWMHWLFNTPPSPFIATGMLVATSIYAFRNILKLNKQIRNLRLGLDGEKAVGQYLEKLRETLPHCRILHDVPGDEFNADHIVISEHGILIIETKTNSKPEKGKAIVQFDGQKILVNGFTPDRDPVVQAKALKSWLENLLQETTGKKFPIKCAVAFPGWFIETPVLSNRSDIWVVNPKALPAFIQNEPICLATEDIALISSRLTDHVHKRTAQ